MYSALLVALILQQTASLTTHFGSTAQWQTYGDGITILVNISSFNLRTTPYIFTRISCTDICWGVSGPTSIYEQIYLRLSDPNWGGCNPLSTSWAAQMNFTLHYVLFVEEPSNQTAVDNQMTSSSQTAVIDQRARNMSIASLVVIAGILVLLASIYGIPKLKDFLNAGDAQRQREIAMARGNGEERPRE